jgi:predicted kinase
MLLESLVERAPYYALARAHRYEVELITFQCSIETALARNIHGVPERTLIAMSETLASRVLPVYWKIRQSTVQMG